MERLRSALLAVSNHLWRQKYMIVAAVLFVVGISIVISKSSDDGIKRIPNYANDVLIARFDIEGKSRFNNENTSMFDPGLLEETRTKWIFLRHNASMPYNLDKPDLRDQSMGQAAKINELLKNMTNGFFVECGAYDGETRSNTLFFERYLDWSGLLIEADPVNFDKMLQKNRRANLSNTCLSPKKYPVIGSFLMANNIGRLHTPHESGGDDAEYLENSPDVAHHGVHVEIQCLPLATYLASLNVKRVDYFSLDIEGLEPEVLETIPFDLIDIRTLSVEFSHNAKSLEHLTTMMEKKGYLVAGLVTHPDNLANDVIFVKKDLETSLAWSFIDQLWKKG